MVRSQKNYRAMLVTCADLRDHKCEGEPAMHLGAICTMHFGAIQHPFRVVYISKSKAWAIIMPRIRRSTPEGHNLDWGIRVTLDKNGKYYEEGRRYAGQQPIKLGLGITFDDPSV